MDGTCILLFPLSNINDGFLWFLIASLRIFGTWGWLWADLVLRELVSYHFLASGTTVSRAGCIHVSNGFHAV